MLRSRSGSRFTQPLNLTFASLKNSPFNKKKFDQAISQQQINNDKWPRRLQEFYLLTMDDLTEEGLEHCTKMTEALKRPHPALLKITNNMDPNELIDILKGCPDITAKILTTVNSAAFGLKQPITSINHAIIYLGLSLVKTIATQFVVKHTMQMQSTLNPESYKKLWEASYITSSLAFMIAQSLALSNAAELSTQALLQSIGYLAIVSYQPEFTVLYTEGSSLLERVEMEQKKLGLNSSIVATKLAKQWKLPDKVVYAIENSLAPLLYPEKMRLISLNEKQALIFCYFASRLGDLVAFSELRDIADFSLSAQRGYDYYFLQQALEETELSVILNLFEDPTFRNKTNRLIASIYD